MAEYTTYDKNYNIIEQKSYNYCEGCGKEVKRSDCLWDTFSYWHSGTFYSVNFFYCDGFCKERRTNENKQML